MTITGITRVLRQQPYYKDLLATLDELGIRHYVFGPGGKHFILTFEYGEKTLRLPLPTSPNARGAAARYVSRNLRALVAGAESGHAAKI